MSAHGPMPRSAWIFPALAVLFSAGAGGGLCAGQAARARARSAKHGAPGLTFVLSMPAFGTGRTNILFGLVHVVVFAVFMFLVFVP